ncbi:MAG: exodeoxyribonuclease VII large subunit, partial [Candidatus Omnitrophica bacterium]|nr:exodeoxyribonuclease VII large subunit [Candidatus Omnitrophota bacterium]
MRTEHVFTVSELTREIAFFLEDKYPGVWVEGEISNFTRSSSGHCYFSLKDEDSTLKCVMFKSSSARTRFSPEDGLSVLCSGKIGVYNKQGQYQLYVDRIEPRGKGALYIAFEQLKEKLSKEGLFSEERKRRIPPFPRRVAVVTSATGAAIRDIITVARRRDPGIEITVYPVMVQGEGAKDEIASAIASLNEYNGNIGTNCPGGNPIDVMIVGRGGGSIEDLWAFNEEIVARAIAASDIPVVSAVGHEIDFTISDFVADKRAPTPSAAAEMIIADKNETLSRVESLLGRMGAAAKAIIGRREAELKRLKEAYVLREP